MPTAQTNTSPTPVIPGVNRFEFDCGVCDQVEYAASSDLPEGWSTGSLVETDRGIAFCPECTNSAIEPLS